jgi:hypothetical protein
MEKEENNLASDKSTNHQKRMIVGNSKGFDSSANSGEECFNRWDNFHNRVPFGLL